MATESPEMKSMFGGKPSGGFFDIGQGRPGDIPVVRIEGK